MTDGLFRHLRFTMDGALPPISRHEPQPLAAEALHGLVAHSLLQRRFDVRDDRMIRGIGGHRGLLLARLRQANQDASAGSVEELVRIVAHLSAVWPTVRITIRADSGFCRDALLGWCEQQGVDYVIGLAKNKRLTALIAADLTAVETESVAAGAPVRRFTELTYETLDSWSRARRVVAKAEYLPTAGATGAGKSNPRFVVTSLARAACDARTLYEARYCARGEMENRIKEQQLMLFADRTIAVNAPAPHRQRAIALVAHRRETAPASHAAAPGQGDRRKPAPNRPRTIARQAGWRPSTRFHPHSSFSSPNIPHHPPRGEKSGLGGG